MIKKPFNPIPTRLFLCSNNQGIVTPPPLLAITLLPFSESIQVKFPESLSKNESLDTTLVSMETMVSVLTF